MFIPFNKPYLSGNELQYMHDAVKNGKIAGDGIFTKKCQDFFESQYSFKKTLLTTSCTSALEMAALLIDIKPGDEVILPAYTFVSTANAFVLRGAKIVFADSYTTHPDLDAEQLETLINAKTKAIVPVHYGGISCDMDAILSLANKHHLFVVEDAAPAVDSFYKDKPLGSLGHLAAFSFHETKNIISGEGGMLVINDEKFIERAEIIREKGTNRNKFFRGEVNKYEWVDIGSSFLPSDLIAAYLYAQLENLASIQAKRKSLWQYYYVNLKHLEKQKLISLPHIPSYSTNNAHIFYLIVRSLKERTGLIAALKKNGILAVFHYLSLHKSPFYAKKYKSGALPNAEHFSDCLVRLPMYYELEHDEQDRVIGAINEFYDNK